jgi:uncharacterized protein (TIRG00374 family)
MSVEIAKSSTNYKKLNAKNVLNQLKRKVISFISYKKLILIFFSSFLLYIMLKDVELNEILTSIKSANVTLLIIAFSLHAIGLTISAFRWKLLLKTLKVKSSISYLIRSYLVATFFNHFIPSTIGGDSVRAYDSYKLGKDKTKGLVVIMIDRFLGLLALIILVIVSTFLSIEVSSKIPSLTLWITFFSLAAAFVISFILWPPISLFIKIKDNSNKLISKIGKILYKFGNAFAQFSNNKRVLFKSLILSFLLQANVVFYYYLISVALGFDVHIINFSLIIPLTVFVLMIPISVNGIGLRENVLFFFFSFFGIAKTQVIAFAWIEFSMLLLLGVIGGVIYVLRK